jgi:hypothetical protein
VVSEEEEEFSEPAWIPSLEMAFDAGDYDTTSSVDSNVGQSGDNSNSSDNLMFRLDCDLRARSGSSLPRRTSGEASVSDPAPLYVPASEFPAFRNGEISAGERGFAPGRRPDSAVCEIAGGTRPALSQRPRKRYNEPSASAQQPSESNSEGSGRNSMRILSTRPNGKPEFVTTLVGVSLVKV